MDAMIDTTWRKNLEDWEDIANLTAMKFIQHFYHIERKKIKTWIRNWTWWATFESQFQRLKRKRVKEASTEAFSEREMRQLDESLN